MTEAERQAALDHIRRVFCSAVFDAEGPRLTAVFSELESDAFSGLTTIEMNFTGRDGTDALLVLTKDGWELIGTDGEVLAMNSDLAKIENGVKER